MAQSHGHGTLSNTYRPCHQLCSPRHTDYSSHNTFPLPRPDPRDYDISGEQRNQSTSTGVLQAEQSDGTVPLCAPTFVCSISSHILILSRAGNNSIDYLPLDIAQLQALKDLDVVNNNLRFLSAEMTTMTLTNLNVHTNTWYSDLANTSGPRDGAKFVDSATRVLFRVPPLREVVLRYLLTPAANQQRPLVPSPPASLVTTTYDARRPLSNPATGRHAYHTALIVRLMPTAVSAPRRHAFSRATTSGPGEA